MSNKTSGLGDNFYVGGYDLSGDVSSVDVLSAPLSLGDITGIKSLANERLGLQRTADWQFTSFFNFVNLAREHSALSPLPRTDVIANYYRGTAIGNPAAGIVAKQIDYDPTRDTSGNLTLKVDLQANAFGMEWGKQLTPGIFVSGNSTFEGSGSGSTDNWQVGGGAVPANCTIAASNAQAQSGTWSLALTSAASGDMAAVSCLASNILTQGFLVSPTSTYTLSGWFRTAVSARSCAIGINWYDSTGASISATFGNTVTDSTSVWTQGTAALTPPSNAAYGRLAAKVSATGGASEVHYLDSVTVSTASLTSVDNGASTSFGFQAYLQVFNASMGSSLQGDVTVKLQDSADNSSFSDVSGGLFTQVTSSARQAQRLQSANTATLREYVKAATITTAGYGHISYALAVVRNFVAGVVF